MTRRTLLAFAFTLLPGLALADETQPGPPAPAEPASKKERFLADKDGRKDVRLARLPAQLAAVVPVSLLNLWTHETLPVDPAHPPAQAMIDEFLRCHFTNQTTLMDPRLTSVLLGAARRYQARVIEIVSAFRAPKYNLMLRKKGHEVARDSQHPLGHAVDFRLDGVSTKALQQFVRSQRIGGVGYYPRSSFVHADVGPVRFWRGH